MNNYFQSAAAIADEVLLEHVTDAPCPAIPRVCNLTRQANRRRQKDRPNNPVDLDFEVNLRHIPDGFLQADVRVGDRRHLVFSTQHMSLLATAKTWCMDATFKVVKEPFTQLFSIHAFVKHDDKIKQVRKNKYILLINTGMYCYIKNMIKI